MPEGGVCMATDSAVTGGQIGGEPELYAVSYGRITNVLQLPKERSMSKFIIALCVAILALVACQPSETAVQVAVQQTLTAAPTSAPTATPAPTDTAVPTPTPTLEPTATPEPTETAVPPTSTPVSIADIDLEPLLLQDGDLPPHLVPDFVSRELTSQWMTLEDLQADNFINQEFYNTDRKSSGGAVIIYLYENIKEADRAYEQIAPAIDWFPTEVDDVGEKAKMQHDTPQHHLIFKRCGAFVYIWMIDVREYDIVTYAQRLDGRLSAVICPGQ